MGDSAYQTTAGPAPPPKLEMDLNDLNERLQKVVNRVHDTVARVEGAQPIKAEIGLQADLGTPSHLRKLSSLSDKVAELENLTKQLALLV